ncbi:MAG: glycosyltransferase family 39 protein [Candidatus Omnitrophica bacterium]|nr:glycosyltransferase family 39 protein [Candidatus Omnitrophota bacterium]
MRIDTFRVRDSKEDFFLPAAFLFVLGTRLWLLLNTVDFHGIAAGRVLWAELMLKNRLGSGAWFSAVHPPLHLFFLAAGLSVFDLPLLVPRLISLLFGSLLVFPFYHYVKKAFDAPTALFSTIAVAFYSEHIVYSVMATSETAFHFFVFLSLLGFVLFDRDEKKYLLIGSGVSVGLASLCRYEGMLLIPVMGLFLLRKKRAAPVFLLAAAVLPAMWMALNYRYAGDALQFVKSNDCIVPLQYDWMRSQGVTIGRWDKLLFWPRSLLQTLGPVLFIFAWAGVGRCLLRREKLFPAGLFLLLFGVFVLRTVEERLYLQSRYGITLGLLLIPFGFFMALRCIDFFQRRWLRSAVLLLVGSMIPGIGPSVCNAPLSAPYFARDIAACMRDTVKPGENIIMDHCGDEKYREPIKLLSGIDPR